MMIVIYMYMYILLCCKSVITYTCYRPILFTHYIYFFLLFVVALWNRADHYIFALWFLLLSSSSSFFPRLVSAVADWMSAILPHVVWPLCEFKMQV